MQSMNISGLNLEELRAAPMTDTELIRFGAGRYMTSPEANLGKPPRETFVIQLREARAEWRRRHPKEEKK